MGYSVSFFLLILVPASSWGQTGPPFHHYATAPVGMTILWDYRQPSSRRFRDISCHIIVIPTGADPDFLPHCIGHSHVCAFPWERRMKSDNANKFLRKSGVA
jgi:hypothetical protein